METRVTVESVRTFETRGGNTRYVIRDENGHQYTTFRPQIGEAAMGLEGRPATLEFHEEQRGRYRNVYLDAIEPAETPPPDGETDPEEAAWRTAVDAAPWLVGSSAEDEVGANELFDKLKPFKDRVAEDIRDEDGEPAS
jgi:hypothetical protein